MSDDSGSDSGSGGLARRHRRELRALEAEWLKKIKAVPKANKKGKKALQAAMADAVDEARARHVRELEGDGGGSDDGGGSEDGGGSCGSADADGDAPAAEPAAGAAGGTGDKLSKKQRRQMAREARTEAILAEARADSLNAPDHAAIERAAIVARLTPHGLVQEEIKGDGHCLFRAVGAQLARRTEGDPELADVVEMLDACRLAGDRAAWVPCLLGSL
jgi:OTU domain-containing protein 6